MKRRDKCQCAVVRYSNELQPFPRSSIISLAGQGRPGHWKGLKGQVGVRSFEQPVVTAIPAVRGASDSLECQCAPHIDA